MFEYFISLGPACPIAASMSKYGLRSFSGPFDWLYTPELSWVLHYIETDFKDFLLQKNLEGLDDNSNHFQDKQSGIRFIHDKEDFKSEYEKLRHKYNRRIENFLKSSKYKTCYLRSIQGVKEIEYIKNNVEYIKSVIQKYNCDSEIVFLCNSNLPVSRELKFRFYRLPGAWSAASYKALRAYFDHADEFFDFCGENYSGAKLLKNLAVDFERKEKSESGLVERRYKTLTALLTHNFNNDIMPQSVIIYGAGVIGRELYRKIRDYTKIRFFVDREKEGEEFEGIKIISVNELLYKYEQGEKVIVSVTYDFEKIREVLLGKFKNEDIICLDDILNLKF